MAAIAPSDPYQALSRKIGYSVGLEFVADRVNKLVDLYVADGDVSFASWTKLVEDFGRKKGLDRAKIEFANFFGALGLIRLNGREVQVLPGLDTLSILRRFIADDEDAYAKAYRTVLGYYLVSADGDILLNCLAGSFTPLSVKPRLEGMVRSKWDRLSRVIKNPGLQKKVWDIIAIKSERGEKGGKTVSKSPFSPRGGPSPFERRREPFDASPSINFSVENSYLEKVLPTRKGWATDLELYANGHITDSGRRLLSDLGALGLKCGEESFCFWPYEAELTSLRIKAKELGIEPISDWALLCTLAIALGGIPAQAAVDDATAEEVLNTIQQFHALYRSGSKFRGSIRHQLPIYVAKPLIVARSVAEGRPIPPLMEIVDKEARSARRRVTVTHIRGTEGALVFKTV